MQRDFTYIEDIIKGVGRVLQHIPQPNPQWQGDNPDPSNSFVPYKLYNIGNNNRVELLIIIKTMENYLGQKVVKICSQFNPAMSSLPMPMWMI